MIDELCSPTQGIGCRRNLRGEMTVVFDAGQNSAANFEHLRDVRPALRRVGPAQRLPRPARPARTRRKPVDKTVPRR